VRLTPSNEKPTIWPRLLTSRAKVTGPPGASKRW
jgi:hypothetical protein